MTARFLTNNNIQVICNFATRIRLSAEKKMNKLKLVKTIVMLLTFLLIFGTLTFLSLLLKKSKETAVSLPDAVSLNQPMGSYIKQISQNEGNLYLLTVGGGLEDRVIIFDTNTGKTITTVNIN